MLQVPHQHLQLIWNSIDLQIILHGINKQKVYILLTNTVKLIFADAKPFQQICTKCNKEMHSLVFRIKKQEFPQIELQQQINHLKYCIVPFKDNICKVDEVIGYKSLFANKKTTLIAHNLIVSSEKKVEFDRELYYTTLTPSLKHLESPQEIQEGNNFSSSVVYSLQKDMEIIEKYQIFVTKLQRQIGENNKNKMFYQYAWNQIEIQYIMRKIQKYFGSVQSLLPRQRYLCFTFHKNKNDCFFTKKYDAIGRQILLKDNIKIRGNIINYYIVSKQQILHNELQTAKLFLLPNNEKIIEMLIICQWIIIAAQTYILFVHSQRPMQFFHHEQNIYPTQITSHLNNKMALITDKRGYIYCFLIENTKVSMFCRYHVPFVLPYSLVHLQCGLAIAGIDVEQNKKSKESRRSIYIVKLDSKQKKGKQQKTNKLLPIQVRLQVIISKNKEIMKPINNVKSTKQKNVIACTCDNKFYLISLEGYKLIQLELKSVICKMMPIPFLFNHLNFLLLAQNEEIIRVGIECYGQSLGAQLNQIRECKAKDCILVGGLNPKFQMYTSSGTEIDRVSYLDDCKKRFIKEENGKILKISSSKVGIAYLLDLGHSVELKFLQV